MHGLATVLAVKPGGSLTCNRDNVYGLSSPKPPFVEKYNLTPTKKTIKTHDKTIKKVTKIKKLQIKTLKRA